MTVEVRKLQELTLESLPEGVEVLRLDNDGVILREMKILPVMAVIPLKL